MALVLQPSSSPSQQFRLSHFSPVRDPLRSPSSVMESKSNSRISLPPISSLIDGPSKDLTENGPEPSPQSAHARKNSLPSPTQSLTHERLSHLGSPLAVPPATPPLPPASSFNFSRHHAPSIVSPTTTSAPSSNYFTQGPPSASSETFPQRNSSYPPLADSNRQPPRTSAYPPLPEPQPWSQPPPAQAQPPPEQARSENDRPTQATYQDATSHNSYPPPTSIQQQQPLPTNFPPPYPGPIDPQMAPQWPQQYHTHPFPPQATHSYPQSQGGYPCPSCSRTFSRPSSLRIHMNSHTGEKPFACQYPGCNKRFSVRSNRKRHERGCHERPKEVNNIHKNNGPDEGHSPGTKYSQ